VTDLSTVAMLRDSIAHYTDANYSFLQRRALLAQPSAFSTQAWRDYAELGWLALRLPEEQGGMDADARSIGVLMEHVGSHLLMEPLLVSTVLGTGLLLRQASEAQRAAWLPLVVEGSMTVVFAHQQPTERMCTWRDGRLFGQLDQVLHGDTADKLIVAAQADSQPVLCVVDAAQVQRQTYRLVDGRSAASMAFKGVVTELLGTSQDTAAAAIALAHDEAHVALCAETLGVINRLVQATNAYLKIRTQFGRPIGSNQALQHRMVELYLLQQEAHALVDAAQDALMRQGGDRTRIIRGARAFIIHAARRIGNEAIQMHGGLGVTEELDISHYFRRLMVLATLFGNRDHHFSAFMAASGEQHSEDLA